MPVSRHGCGELIETRPQCVHGAVEWRFGIERCEGAGHTLRTVAPTGPWMDGPHGGRQAGSVGVQFDHVMGGVLYAVAPEGHWALTTELTFDVVAVLPRNVDATCVTGSVVQHDSRGGFARAELVDEHGVLLAVGSTRVHYVPGQTRMGAEEERADIDRYGVNFPAHLGAQITADDDSARVDLLEPERWANPFGALHGGVWAGLVELAGSEILTRRRLRTAHVDVTYLRRAALDTVVSAIARPLHLGRAFGVVQITGIDGTGRQCVLATVTGRSDAI